MIHGDVKPENVLICNDEIGAYAAKIMDFEYSTHFAGEKRLLTLGKSWPWSAPELLEGNKFTSTQARMIDAFSYGMLCLWLLFEKYLSRITPLPREAQWADRYFQGKGKMNLSKTILNDLKQENKLVTLARQLVMGESDIDGDKKRDLEGFFNALLTPNQTKPETDLTWSLGCLLPNL